MNSFQKKNNNIFGDGEEEDMSLASQVNEMYNVMVNGKPGIFAIACHALQSNSTAYNYFSSDSNYFTATGNTITILKDGTYYIDILVGGSGLNSVTLNRGEAVVETYTSAVSKKEIELLTWDVLTVTSVVTHYTHTGCCSIIVYK